MLIILRLVFGVVLLYELVEGAGKAPGASGAGDLTGAWYLIICVTLGFLNALVWAPFFGEKVSGPLTGTITESTYVERINWVIRMIRWLDARGHRRWVVAFCFLEGVRYPSSPAAFVLGFKNARPGSWLEKVYGREVFRFNNTQNAIQAFLALKRRGLDPRPHRNQEVNIILLSLEKPPRPEPAILPVPPAPEPAVWKRNRQIRIFKRPGDAEPAELAEPIAAASQVPSTNKTDSLPLEASVSAVPAVDRTNPWTNLVARVTNFIRAH